MYIALGFEHRGTRSTLLLAAAVHTILVLALLKSMQLQEITLQCSNPTRLTTGQSQCGCNLQHVRSFKLGES